MAEQLPKIIYAWRQDSGMSDRPDGRWTTEPATIEAVPYLRADALAGRDPEKLEALVEAWGDGPSSVMDEQRVLAAVAAFLGEGDES